MGWIDLDPASSEAANAFVKARKIYTIQDNGLVQPWHGRVFMNHPFSREFNRAWIQKLVAEYENDEVEQACCITFAATSEAWFRPLLRQPNCFLVPRTNYYLPDGTKKRGVTKGSVVTYFGEHADAFARCFAHLGEVKIAHQYTRTV